MVFVQVLQSWQRLSAAANQRTIVGSVGTKGSQEPVRKPRSKQREPKGSWTARRPPLFKVRDGSVAETLPSFAFNPGPHFLNTWSILRLARATTCCNKLVHAPYAWSPGERTCRSRPPFFSSSRISVLLAADNCQLGIYARIWRANWHRSSSRAVSTCSFSFFYVSLLYISSINYVWWRFQVAYHRRNNFFRLTVPRTLLFLHKNYYPPTAFVLFLLIKPGSWQRGYQYHPTYFVVVGVFRRQNSFYLRFVF